MDNVSDAEDNAPAEEIIQEYVVIIQLQENDKHILRCPIELHQQINKSVLKEIEMKNIRTNYYRGLIPITTNAETEVRKILAMNQLSDIRVSCRWSKDTTNNCGVIGTIPCPNIKETKERKIEVYKEALRNNGHPVNSIEWIRKKVWKRGVRGHTMVTTGYLKLEFINEVPKEVFLGSVKYEVDAFIADTIQCWKCQKLGHVSAHCNSPREICVFCGTKGHSKRDNRCGNRRVCCANCGKGHPASYRGCIEFLREKEAQKIKAKEKTPIYNARRLASNKEFPHLQAREGQPATDNSSSNREQSRGYAEAAAPRLSIEPIGGDAEAATPRIPPSQGNERQRVPPHNRDEEEIQPQRDDREMHQIRPQGEGQTNKTCQNCNSCSNDKKIEKKLNKIMNKTIAKLLFGLAEVFVQIYKVERIPTKLSEQEKLQNFTTQIGASLTKLLGADSDSSDSESETEDEMSDNEEAEEEPPNSSSGQGRGGAASAYKAEKSKRKKKKKKNKKTW